MANGITHSVVGGLSGLAVALSDKDGNDKVIHDPFLAVGVGTFFGKLPDILEPATNNPNHRQLCHSLVALTAVGYGLKKAYEWQPKNNFDSFMRGIALFAGVGYLSHLLLDSVTPKSLPLLGKF